MKKMKKLTRVLVLMLVACLSVALLVGCGDKTETPAGDETQAGTNTGLKTYNITVNKGLEYGKIEANPLKAENGGTAYEIVVTPKLGYEVKTLTIGGVQLEVKDNKANCVLGGDCALEVTYQRKNNEELASRRTKVLDEMKLITGTYFKFNTTYDYKITSGKAATIDSGYLYQGMPYSNFPTVSYYQFIKDYTTGADENGVYQVKDIWADPLNFAIVGNNCADAIYWSWSAVSTTMNCVVSGAFSEPNGLVNIGTFTVQDGDLDAKNQYVDTAAVAQRNGMFTMCDSYAMLMRGDAVMNATNGAGHIVMIDEVNVVYGSDGKINGDRSYIIYYDQNAGYSEKNGYLGQKVMSSTENGDKWTFTQMFNDGYLPMTCKELMDESFAIEEEKVSDSLNAAQFTKMNVTRGFIESNYYFSKIRMEITDANGNTVYAGDRFRDELNPKRVALSWFTQTNGTEYKHMTIYNDVFDMNALTDGSTYHCKVTVWLASGNEYVVRDFDFTK